MHCGGLDFGSFRIGFDERDRTRLHELWDEVLDVLADLDATLYPQAELANRLYAPTPRTGDAPEDASSRTQ